MQVFLTYGQTDEQEQISTTFWGQKRYWSKVKSIFQYFWNFKMKRLLKQKMYFHNIYTYLIFERHHEAFILWNELKQMNVLLWLVPTMVFSMLASLSSASFFAFSTSTSISSRASCNLQHSKSRFVGPHLHLHCLQRLQTIFNFAASGQRIKQFLTHSVLRLFYW